MNRTVQMTFKTEQEKAEILEYIKEKKFRNIGDFALFSMKQYQTRNPLTKCRERPVQYCTGILNKLTERIKMLENKIKE